MRSGNVSIGRNQFVWLAGLLEGEGSFSVRKDGLRSTAKVCVNMTDKDVIEHVASLVVSRIQTSRLHKVGLKPQYIAQISGGSAVSFLQILAPLMGQRRQQQIARAIAAYNPKVPYGHRYYHVIPNETEESERYWLAGYLEGEASFLMKRYTIRGKRYQYPAIEVNSTDRDVIERVQLIWRDRYNSCVHINLHQPKYPGSKLVYRVELNNTNARGVMEDICPLLGERRRAKIQSLLCMV